MKKLVDQPKDPIPCFIQVNGEYKPIQGVYPPGEVVQWHVCGECSTMLHSLKQAQECCQQMYCECGQKRLQYYTICRQCSDKKKFEGAELVEYQGGYVCVFDGDEYFTDMDDLIDHYFDEPEDERPDYVHPCTENKWGGIDVESVLENEMEDFYEDAFDHLPNTKDLEAFVADWCKKANMVCWMPDLSKKIKIPYEESEQD